MKVASLSLLVAIKCKEADSLASSRRSFLQSQLNFGVIVTTLAPPAFADEVLTEAPDNINVINAGSAAINRGGRPFAPPAALLPAARLKIWVDGVYVLSCSLAAEESKDEQYKIIQKMNSVLSKPPKLFYSEKFDKRAGGIAQLTAGVSSANKGQYQETRKSLNAGDKFAAMLNQADVERQWGMLQYAESKREESNEMRAAFNFYTRQLTFADNYVLTASKEDKKRMIRNDELPSLTAVITSDLDRRDLYRNQFLTAIEDAQAEIAYQSRQLPDEIDIIDATDLVNQAYAAAEKWFDLIAPQDVDDAMDRIHSKK